MGLKKKNGGSPNPLEKAVGELQREINEIRGSQVAFYSEVQSQLEIQQIRDKQYATSGKLMKRLVSKLKEQEIRIDTLMKVLGGKFKNHKCQCGKMYPLIDLHLANPAENDSEDSSDDKMESNPQHKEGQKRRRKKKPKSNHEETRNINDQLPEDDPEYIRSKIQTFEEENLEEISEDETRDDSVSVQSSSATGNDMFRWSFKSLKSHRSHEKTNWQRIFHGNDKAFIQSEWFSLPLTTVPLLGTVRFRGIDQEYYEVQMGLDSQTYSHDFRFPFELSVRAKILRIKHQAWHTNYHKFVFASFSNFVSSRPNKFFIKINKQDKQVPPRFTFIFKKD